MAAAHLSEMKDRPMIAQAVAMLLQFSLEINSR
jgi:hypothetical protein